jgi:non-ribosomal peptide synthetase component F
MKYSYFPLQRILAQHPNTSKPAFLDTSFVFHSTENENTENKVIIGNSRLHAMSKSIRISEDEIMSKFDFTFIINHDLNINQFSCTINASLDLFNTATIDKISQRFHSMLHQLFQFIISDQMSKPIYELSLILPNERLLMQSLNNTQVLFPSTTCIHHEFVFQVMKHPQKLAVELDEQSLTYSELLYYIQLLSLNLLHIHGVIPREIVCQCVERSLAMVS